MGVKSTQTITKQRAKEIVIENLNSLSCEELGRIIDVIWDDKYMNANVVDYDRG